MFGTESIDYISSPLVPELIAGIRELRQYDGITSSVLSTVDLSKIIRKYTNLNIQFILHRNSNIMGIATPTIDKNNIIIRSYRKQVKNLDSEALLRKVDYVDGSVDLSNNTVHGVFRELVIDLHIGESWLWRSSGATVDSVVAMILHEVGHIFVYLELLGRAVRTNYIVSEAVQQLTNTKDPVARVRIYGSAKAALGDTTTSKVKDNNTNYYKSLLLTSAVKESEHTLGYNIYDSRAFEQQADLYVSRLGLGKALAIGLDKLHKEYTPIAYRNTTLNCMFNVLKLGAFISSTLIGNPFPVIYILLTPNPINISYDKPRDRILKIKQQYNHQLKDRSLPKHLKRSILEDISVIDDILKDMRDNSGIYEVLYRYSLGYGEYRGIKRQQRIEELVNNDLIAATAVAQGI